MDHAAEVDSFHEVTERAQPAAEYRGRRRACKEMPPSSMANSAASNCMCPWSAGTRGSSNVLRSRRLYQIARPSPSPDSIFSRSRRA